MSSVWCCRLDCDLDSQAVIAKCDRAGCKSYMCSKHAIRTRYRFELCPNCYTDYVTQNRPEGFCSVPKLGLKKTPPTSTPTNSAEAPKGSRDRRRKDSPPLTLVRDDDDK